MILILLIKFRLEFEEDENKNELLMVRMGDQVEWVRHVRMPLTFKTWFIATFPDWPIRAFRWHST